MSSKIAQHVAKHASTPQSEPIPGMEAKMVQNAAGGYVFQIDAFTCLERFLIMGSEGGTYYTTERKLTIDNCKQLSAAAQQDFDRTLNLIVTISVTGRAPKNDYAIFALAYLSSLPFLTADQRSKVYNSVNSVCRTGTHILQFFGLIKQLRGTGSGVMRALSRWYLEKTPADVAFQVTKYAQRDGVSHRDILRQAHPVRYFGKLKCAQYIGVFGYALGKEDYKFGRGKQAQPAKEWIEAVCEVKAATTEKEVVKLITKHKLPREVIPTQFLNSVAVWEAMLLDMPPMAMLRNLAKMTSMDMLKPLSANLRMVCDRLTDGTALKKARLHPFAILLALNTYKTGKGLLGSLTWQPVQQLLDALDASFHASFSYVEPTGKRRLLGMDISGSMFNSRVLGTSMTAAEASAAMAMTTIRSESNYHTLAFTGQIEQTKLSPHMTLEQILDEMARLSARMGDTDCAQAIKYATQNRLEVDSFEIHTDGETWAGNQHTMQALQKYRQVTGIPAKLLCVAYSSTSHSIGDVDDAGVMNFAGFDAAGPQVMANFIGSKKD